MRTTSPARGGLCLALAAILVAVGAAPAFGHGSMSDPVSRSLLCFRENPETPDSDACRAAIAAGGTQPFYDWMEVNIMDAAGRHRELIPDGKLCGAGREKYRGLDLARGDWPATPLSAGANYTFRYAAPTPHGGRFDLYVTRDGYNPTEPLRWSDLEPAPFLTAVDPPVIDGEYVMPGRLPAGKSGRHLIYSIWQRHPTDSPEAFYTCSDVDFGGSGSLPPFVDPSGDWGTDVEPPTAPETGNGGPHGGGPGRDALKVRFKTESSWPGGYVGRFVIRNRSQHAVGDWRLAFRLARGTTIDSTWDALLARSGSRVRFVPESWNREIAPGERVSFGFTAVGNARPRRVVAGLPR